MVKSSPATKRSPKSLAGWWITTGRSASIYSAPSPAATMARTAIWIFARSFRTMRRRVCTGQASTARFGGLGRPRTWFAGRRGTSMRAPSTWLLRCRRPSCARGGCCMTPDELRRDEACRWLVLAGKDLNSARLLMAEEPANFVFHSRQAAEKAAKAFLAFHNIPFRKTHDLKELGAQCVAVDRSEEHTS